MHTPLHQLAQQQHLNPEQTQALWRLAGLHASPPDVHHRLRQALAQVAALLLAFLIRVPWVQTLLGVAFAAVVAHVDWYAWLGLGGELSESFFWMQPRWPSLWLLAAACWAWCASESRWGGKPWVPKMHALMNGVAVGLLLVILLTAQTHITAGLWGHVGSADALDAGQQALFHFNFHTISASLLVLAAGLWLAWRWGGWPGAWPAEDQAIAPGRQALTGQTEGRIDDRIDDRAGATWALLYGLWAVAALVMPIMGVLAVLFTVALATGRRRVCGLSLLVVLAQLSAFYYALQWPLAHKAVLLGGAGWRVGLGFVGRAAGPAGNQSAACTT